MATKKPVVKIKPTAKPVPASAKKLMPGTAKPKPSPKKTLPTLKEYKQSAAYKSGDMTYKEYLDFFKARGYK